MTVYPCRPLAITWLGHSSFRLRTPGGKEVLFDPWYTGNPSFPESARPKSGRPDPDFARPLRSHHRRRGDGQGDRRDRRRHLGDHLVARREGRQESRADEQGRHDHREGPSHHHDRCASQQQLRRQRHRLSRRSRRLRRQARERADDLFRRRHVAVRRHEADRRALQARHRVPADRRSLHDGTGYGGDGREVARREAGRADALTARSRC